MNVQSDHFAQRAAVDVYGAFLEECVMAHVQNDRVGTPAKASAGKIDGRPVRLVTISGKGGWSDDPALAERWARNDNISLLDHLLSVARGALMFWLADAPRPWSSESDFNEIERLAYAAVCIAFLHDIDKDLGLQRGEKIGEDAVAERMRRYGMSEFLLRRRLRISPAAMLNYIEEVEGTQAARSPAAPDFDRRIAATCRYVELADKLEGMFTSRESGAGIDGVLVSLRDPNRWPMLKDSTLKRWEKVEIHDHLHVFLLDRFQRALSTACTDIAGRLPLIEIVHDGRLLSVIPQEHASAIKDLALDSFLQGLPYRLNFSVNNRLACAFVGGAASWQVCRDVMRSKGDWRPFVNLLALPKPFAGAHRQEIDELFEAAGMSSSWSPLDDAGATVKPALDHPGGDPCSLDMEPAHALAFLAIVLNHADVDRKGGAPDANIRGKELCILLEAEGMEAPELLAAVPASDGRARRVLLALWTIAEVWRLAEADPDEAQELLDRIVGRNGLAGLWLEGNDRRPGLAAQIDDVSSEIVNALQQRFSSHLNGSVAQPFDADAPAKRCILCNEPVAASRKVSTASRAHGIKASAFSGRDGRNDHLASPSGDTHLCPLCLAESQLRRRAQEEFKGSGDLPPLISSPATTGLFGGLAYQHERAEISMGLNDLNRLDTKKGAVYEGLDCQTRRIRLARLETLPTKDKDLVAQLRMTLTAVQRLGRPIHIFRGAPRRHPGIFFLDALPAWLERLLGGDSLRIEQLGEALSRLELYEHLANKPGLGVEWAKLLADPDRTIRVGALCVAWASAVDRRGSGDADHAWELIKNRARAHALALLRNTGGETVNLRDNQDPLIRLAWLATRIQKRVRVGRNASTNKQLLCWKTALDFHRGAERSTTRDRTALILGLAGMLEEELSRKNDAAAKKHRDDEFRRGPEKGREGESLGEACITFAEHFSGNVWTSVFNSKEPTSQEQRRAAAVYRFALIEAYRERGIAESEGSAVDDDSPGVDSAD